MPAVSNALTTLRVLLLVYGLALGAQAAQQWTQLGAATELHWVLGMLRAGLLTLAAIACGALLVQGRAAAWRWALGSAAVVVVWQGISAVGEIAGQVGTETAGVGAAVLDTVWTLGDQAPRMAVPLALAWSWKILATADTEALPAERLRGVAWLLCGASMLMFFMHGCKLIFAPESVEELLTRSLGRWNGYQLPPETVHAMLSGVGLVHAAAIVAIGWGRYRVPLCYMTLWGMMTALSRISAYGLFAWDEAFLRAANGGAAWAALFLLPSKEPCCDESRLHPEDRTTRIHPDR